MNKARQKESPKQVENGDESKCKNDTTQVKPTKTSQMKSDVEYLQNPVTKASERHVGQ